MGFCLLRRLFESDNPETSIWNSESTVWNPESKTVLDSLTLGDTMYCSSIYRYMLFQFQCIQGCMCSHKIPQCYYRKHWHHTVWSFIIHSLISGRRKKALIFASKVIFEGLYYSRTSTNIGVSTTATSLQLPPSWRAVLHWLLFTGAVSRNSAKLGNYKMPVKLRET